MPDPILFQLGMNAKIYQGATGAALSALSEMGNVRDVNVTLEAGEADVTTRDNGGWEATAPTLRKCSAEWESVWRPGDPGFEAVKTAFLTAGTVELAILDQAKEATGAQGVKGSFSITSFSRKEALQEAITVSVRAKLAKFDEWVTVEFGNQ